MAQNSTRRLAASIGSLTRWSRVHGADARSKALSPARDGMSSKLAARAIAEAGRELTDPELDEAVERLRRAHYRRMSLASAKARAARKPA